MGRTIRAALYSRVSTTHDQNPELQIEALRRYCEANEWRVTHEIIDRGITGATDDRPGLKRLMTLARHRDVDAILVVRFDRLFRNLKHLVTTLEEFNSLGINFVSLKDGVQYHSATGKLMIQILGALSAFELAILQDRVRMGIEHARNKGKILGRPKKRDDEAILALRRQGLSYKQIARKLQVSEGAVYRAIKPTLKTSSEMASETAVKVERFDG